MSNHPKHSQLPPPRRGHLALAALFCTLVAAYGSFVPLQYHPISFSTALERFAEIRLLSLSVYKRADLVANFILFIPLGFLWLGAVDLDRRSRVAAICITPLLAVILAALAVAIEFAQLWFPRRTVSINDIAAESLGGLAGLLLWLIVGRASVRGLRSLAAPSGESPPILRLLRLYTLGLLLYAVQPLDLTFSPTEIERKFADGKINLIPFRYDYGGFFESLWGMGVDFLLFIPIGIMFRLQRPGRSLAAAALMALALAAAIETVQIFIFSRFVDGTDILMAALGGALGAWLAPQIARRGGEARITLPVRLALALALTALYAVPLAAAFWHPFQLERESAVVAQQLRRMIDWPFRKHYYGSEFSAMSNILRGLMLFLPLGALWRWACGPELARWFAARAMVFALITLIGIAIELGQAFLATQYADSTDFLVYLTGAAAGWAAWGLLVGEKSPGGGETPHPKAL